MRLLDLFCGAGGAGEGYRRAGFDVTGIDIRPMPHNPHRFIQADALEYVRENGHEFDFIHASPPCQAHTQLKTMLNAKNHADLIPETRAALRATGKPYVIENVPGASTLAPVLLLCGTMFGLKAAGGELWRHRYFELSFPLNAMIPQCRHGNGGAIGRPRVITVVGHSGGRSRNGQEYTTAERAEAMGIDWMTGSELSQAIPPAYTEFIGQMAMKFLRTNQGREP